MHPLQASQTESANCVNPCRPEPPNAPGPLVEVQAPGSLSEGLHSEPNRSLNCYRLIHLLTIWMLLRTPLAPHVALELLFIPKSPT